MQQPLTHDRMRKRQQPIQQTIENATVSGLIAYYVNIKLGTPAQSFRLHVNTGASDLWVNTGTSTLCSTNNTCENSGTYNANRSSTYKYVNGVFKISYSDGTTVSGDYATDDLRIEGQYVQNVQFGMATSSTDSDGYLGIGYAINEAQVSNGGLAPYSNLPQILAKEEKVNLNAYSLWLNDPSATTGSIVFGGVDTAKYSGTLRSARIIPSQGGVYNSFTIALAAVGQNGTYNLMSNASMPTLLATDLPFSYLPSNITTVLFKQFNVSYDPSAGAAIVDCQLASQPGTIDFSLSSANVSIPLRTLVIPYSPLRVQPICLFGIIPAPGDQNVMLGTTFLRAAYVVFDPDNNQISLAQTRFNITEEKIVEIGRGAGGMPTSAFNILSSSATSVISSTNSPTGGSENGNRNSST